MSRANEPASPMAYASRDRNGDICTEYTGGLTIREHFAGLIYPHVYTHWRAHMTVEQCAIEVVQYADALIAELAKPAEHYVICGWGKGHISHTVDGMEYDEEIVPGKDCPPGEGWGPVYRLVKS